MAPSALLSFSDVLAAQASGELPYARLKKLLRAVRDAHPAYPRRSRRPPGCEQLCSLSQTQAAAKARGSVQRGDESDGEEDAEEPQGCEDGVEMLQVARNVLTASDDSDEDRDMGILVAHQHNSQSSRSTFRTISQELSPLQSLDPNAAEKDIEDVNDAPQQNQHTETPREGLEHAQSTPNDLPREETSNPTFPARSPHPSDDDLAWPSPPSPPDENNHNGYKTPKRRRVPSLPRSQSQQENLSTLSNPLVAPTPSSQSPPGLSARAPGKRIRISSSPPSHVSIGLEINAILNALIEHDWERGESVKWLHLRCALTNKDPTLYEPFCTSMDRVFAALDPLAAYNGDRGENSQNSARMCVFYSNLFWQDAWREFCYDCKLQMKFKGAETKAEKDVQPSRSKIPAAQFR